MPRALYVVSVDISPESEVAWVHWLQVEHIPELLRQPGFLACRMWRDRAGAADAWTRYLIQYELSGLEALDRYLASGEAKRLRGESESRFGQVTRISRQVLSEVLHAESPEATAPGAMQTGS